MNTTSTEARRRRCVGLRDMTIAVLALVAVGAAFAADNRERPVDRLQREARGFYLLWSEGRPDEDALLSLPFVRGGQVVVQWSEVEPAPGVYDFSALDARLARYARRDAWTTVQVNGNTKPAWLFAVVPHVRERLHSQVRDPAGTLMFWHPRFQDAHLAMIAALGRHLRESPACAKLLGVRLNFNAVGTEQFIVPAPLREPAAWEFPARGGAAGLQPYADEVRSEYARRVVEAYAQAFADWTVVFVRNSIEAGLAEQIAPDLRAGRLALFHTSSEAEPRAVGTERQYGRFVDFARSGQTVAYAEPWASAWGEHGGMVDHRWCSPAQWNYWTLLLNLHCGVSFIGEYYTNLHFAASGEPHAKARDAADDDPREFMAAYEWGSRYVGRHNLPAESPGAWVAFRENTEVKAQNANVPPAGRQLARFVGDYTWLMERVDGDGSAGVGPVGPAEQRYGAFARRYPGGSAARLQLDPVFRRSLMGQAGLRIIYLDDGPAGKSPQGEVRLATPGGATRVGELRAGGTGRWQMAELAVSAAALQQAPAGWQLEVRAGERPLVLHLVEVLRSTSSGQFKK